MPGWSPLAFRVLCIAACTTIIAAVLRGGLLLLSLLCLAGTCLGCVGLGELWEVGPGRVMQHTSMTH